MTDCTEIAAWLRTLPSVHDCDPCHVTIGDVTYPATRYRQTCQTTKGTPAYGRGEREYVNEMIYVVGMLPKCYLRSAHIAFTLAGDQREWYVASYFGDRARGTQAVAEPSEYHPFGNMFLLSPWSVEGLIDAHENKPYERRVMTVAA